MNCFSVWSLMLIFSFIQILPIFIKTLNYNSQKRIGLHVMGNCSSDPTQTMQNRVFKKKMFSIHLTRSHYILDNQLTQISCLPHTRDKYFKFLFQWQYIQHRSQNLWNEAKIFSLPNYNTSCPLTFSPNISYNASMVIQRRLSGHIHTPSNARATCFLSLLQGRPFFE